MLGGLIADRVDRKKFLIILSVEQLVFSLALALVVRGPAPSLVLITLMVVLVGAGGAMFGPAYSAVLPGLVGKADMPGAISLNSAQMNLSRVIGPPIGAVAYHFVGPAWVFGGNALTYLFVVIALMMVTLPPMEPAAAAVAAKSSNFRQLLAGVTCGPGGQDRWPLPGHRVRLLAPGPGLLGPDARRGGAQPRDRTASSANYGILYGCFGMGAFIGAISIGTVFARTSKPLIVRVLPGGYAVTLRVFALLRSRAGLLRGGDHGRVLLRLHHGAEHDDAGARCTTTCGAGSWRCG